jgi:hypothetical protein
MLPLTIERQQRHILDRQEHVETRRNSKSYIPNAYRIRRRNIRKFTLHRHIDSAKEQPSTNLVASNRGL